MVKKIVIVVIILALIGLIVFIVFKVRKNASANTPPAGPYGTPGPNPIDAAQDGSGPAQAPVTTHIVNGYPIDNNPWFGAMQGQGIYSRNQRYTLIGTSEGWVPYGPIHPQNGLLGYYLGSTSKYSLDPNGRFNFDSGFANAQSTDGQSIIVLTTRNDGTGDTIITGWGSDLYVG